MCAQLSAGAQRLVEILDFYWEEFCFGKKIHVGLDKLRCIYMLQYFMPPNYSNSDEKLNFTKA